MVNLTSGQSENPENKQETKEALMSTDTRGRVIFNVLGDKVHEHYSLLQSEIHCTYCQISKPYCTSTTFVLGGT